MNVGFTGVPSTTARSSKLSPATVNRADVTNSTMIVENVVVVIVCPGVGNPTKVSEVVVSVRSALPNVNCCGGGPGRAGGGEPREIVRESCVKLKVRNTTALSVSHFLARMVSSSE